MNAPQRVLKTPAPTLARARVDTARRKEVLDPLQPLKGAMERKREAARKHSRALFQAQIGRLADILVHLLDQAKLGTPAPPPPPPPPVLPIFPQYVPERPAVFINRTPRTLPDWRTALPKPDLWWPKPIAGKPARLTTHGYGSPVRRNWV